MDHQPTPPVPDEATQTATRPAPPWWTRTPVLLGIGAAVLMAALGFALISRDDSNKDVRPEATATTDPGSDTSTSGVAVAPAEGRLLDVKAFEPAWLFRDPNRAVGDGGSGLATATWLLDDRVIVLSADIMRAHSLEDGSVLWQRPLELEPCLAVSNVPIDSEVVVIGVAEPDSLCLALEAIDVDTGEREWTTVSDEEFNLNIIERLVATPAGLFVLDSDGVAILDPENGRVRMLHDDHKLGALASGGTSEDPYFAPDHAAVHADTGVVVVTGTVLRFGPNKTQPTFAFGFDAESGDSLWMTQISPERLDAVPQTQDARFVVLGTGPDEVVKLDLKTGTVASRYPVPAQSELGRPVYEQFGNQGAAWYSSGTVPFDDDLLMTYEQVQSERGSSDDNLVRVDGSTGKEIWRVEVADLPKATEGESASILIAAGPMVDDKHLLATVWNRRRSWIAFIDAATGAVVSMVPQPDEVSNSNIQGNPALDVLDGDRLLMVYNPNGMNIVDDAAITGDDRTSVILMEPAG